MSSPDWLINKSKRNGLSFRKALGLVLLGGQAQCQVD